MSAWQIALVGFAAFCAGAMNSVAGGGTFFSFPALLAVGVPPVVANASNSVALWPASLSGAWAYRKELARYKRYLIPMGLVSFVGGIGGGLLLLATKDATFSRLIPWLLLFATVLFAFSGKLSLLLRGAESGQPGNSPVALAGQAVVSVYGGFFGAGMGILMLASLAMAGHDDVHEINAIKNLLSAVIYSVTVLTFVIAGAVSWPYTLVMLVTATLGGYWGASIARKIPALWLRRFIIAVGFTLTGFYFYKTF
ncbi:sulfite exporter TauE/SafE family protein [Noviherbaspirillum autotrophicum]|uniref:Probable membrane transporter protein n=1 Tax=Noviherbaspirillum autotrophicum TaxID=709839 RepID=A0A0C2BZH0_9BURK|nr:sulfite exporter TauE/SafE family protein [Noviherbaspirillum autotrophicum]KIF83416.1 permease [Noviherbaspirillum autotrophicum]HJW54806.1 sulfite exporter TauE/SafE family protein [Burkholderiaceae bacterium]